VYHLGFSGSFGAHRVNPRTLVASLLGKMVCVEGIVTKCTLFFFFLFALCVHLKSLLCLSGSLVRPKVVTSVHYCPASKAMSVMEYRDATSLEGAPTSSIYPTKDKDGNVLETEYGLSVYKVASRPLDLCCVIRIFIFFFFFFFNVQDHQIISIQEMPEKAPPGQLPRAVEIILDDELVDRVKPGDRIQVAGIYRALAGRVSGVISGSFRYFFLCVCMYFYRFCAFYLSLVAIVLQHCCGSQQCSPFGQGRCEADAF
jgi:DNA replication licensing factor MCM3